MRNGTSAAQLNNKRNLSYVDRTTHLDIAKSNVLNAQ